MNISAPFIHRPVATTLLTVARRARRAARVPAAAGLAAAAGRFPDDSVSARACPARVRKRWPRPWPRRSNGSSAGSPASPK